MPVENYKFANRQGWSDTDPYEILVHISRTTLVIRALDYKLDNWKPEIEPGGFAGHCTNQNDQKYTYSSNTNYPRIRIRLTKKGWKDTNGNRYTLATEPKKFHDYNF